jgi:hypothetical protein
MTASLSTACPCMWVESLHYIRTWRVYDTCGGIEDDDERETAKQLNQTSELMM